LDTATIASVPTALEMCAFGGRVVFVGELTTTPENVRCPMRRAAGRIPVDVNLLHLNRLSLIGSYAVPNSLLPLGHALLSDGLFPVDEIVSHVLPFDQLDSALRLVDERRDGVVKALIQVGG